jgi:hypothetical protein
MGEILRRFIPIRKMKEGGAITYLVRGLYARGFCTPIVRDGPESGSCIVKEHRKEKALDTESLRDYLSF